MGTLKATRLLTKVDSAVPNLVDRESSATAHLHRPQTTDSVARSVKKTRFATRLLVQIQPVGLVEHRQQRQAPADAVAREVVEAARTTPAHPVLRRKWVRHQAFHKTEAATGHYQAAANKMPLAFSDPSTSRALKTHSR